MPARSVPASPFAASGSAAPHTPLGASPSAAPTSPLARLASGGSGALSWLAHWCARAEAEGCECDPPPAAPSWRDLAAACSSGSGGIQLLPGSHMGEG